jgi:hypothetical protein
MTVRNAEVAAQTRIEAEPNQIHGTFEKMFAKLREQCDRNLESVQKAMHKTNSARGKGAFLRRQHDFVESYSNASFPRCISLSDLCEFLFVISLSFSAF